MGLCLAYICPCICPKRFFNGLMFGRGRGKGGGGKGEGVAHYRKDFMFEVWEAYFQEGLLSKLCGVILISQVSSDLAPARQKASN